MKHFLITLLTFALLTLTSCSSDYRAAIPSGCTALISVDATADGVGEQLLPLKDLLHINDVQKCGIDFSKKFYLFETSTGNFGICAKLSNGDDMKALVDAQQKEGFAQYINERQDCHFASLGGKALVGWSSASVLIMGPVMPSAQGEMMNLMVSLLKQKTDESIVGTPMMDRLDSSSAGISLIAQASAFPDKFSSVLTFGLPDEVDPSECLVAADVNIADGMIGIQAQPTSFNSQIESKIKEAYSIFQPIKGRFIPSIDNKALVSVLCDVNGTKLLPLLQHTEGLWALLAGANQAIDLNAIVNAINGDMYLSAPAYSPQGVHVVMAAELANASFLKDVSYWKTSVPKGSVINDWKRDAYCFTDGGMSYYFGVSNAPKLEFYSGTTAEYAESSLAPSSRAIDANMQKAIAGKRLAVVISISSLIPDNMGMVKLMLPRVLKMNHIVYTVQ